MAPRKYRMERRKAAAEATRQRIVEATLKLHAERGILGTSWREIAALADVSVATVYKHFPTLAELMPACGELMERLVEPPTIAEAAASFAGVAGLPERLTRLVAVFLDFYQRGEEYLEVDARERQLPGIQEWEAEMRTIREYFVREALAPLGPDDLMVRSVSALLDFPTYKSFRRQGLTRQEAESFLNRLLLSGIEAGTVRGEEPKSHDHSRRHQ